MQGACVGLLDYRCITHCSSSSTFRYLYIVAGILALAIVLVVIVLRRRKILKGRWFT